MKKTLLILAVFTLGSTAFSQIPNYVPSNGLVGWWPFNGNANDESGNGNNGTVNGLTYNCAEKNKIKKWSPVTTISKTGRNPKSLMSRE